MLRPLAILLALSATACTTTVARPTAKEEAAVWLAESPRAISVEVDRQLPTVTLRTRDHHVGQRVGHGVGGAAVGGVYTVAGGCMAGGPIGCIVGIVLAPVGMVVGGVVGAARVKSTDSVQTANEAGEGPAKMKVEQAAELPVLLEDVVVAQGDRVGRHSLHARQAARGEEQATLRLRFTEIELFGDSGEDPSLALTLRVAAEMQVPGATDADWGSYAYSGSSHWVSTWLKNDGERLRKELRDGANAIARQAAQDLRVAPSRASIAKVAWARKLAADPELDMWERVRDSSEAPPLQSYLDAYPHGRYVKDAQSRLAALKSPMSKFWRLGDGSCVGC